jgi:lysophospholipid acyltransferase (LPLAT)-like uncharacterized protein
VTNTQDSPRGPSLRKRLRSKRKRAIKRLLHFLAPSLVRVYSKTWRTRLSFESDAAREALHGGSLFVTWHGRGAALVKSLRGKEVAVLVSPTGDGALMADMITSNGLSIIVGSSRHDGAAALRELISTLRGGRAIGFTPDGPPGPEHTVSPAVCLVSRATGFPVLPLGVAVDRSWRLNTFDRYTVPKPFARVCVRVLDPIQVPKDARGDEAQAQWGEKVRSAMMEAEVQAFAELGMEPEH